MTVWLLFFLWAMAKSINKIHSVHQKTLEILERTFTLDKEWLIAPLVEDIRAFPVGALKYNFG